METNYRIAYEYEWKNLKKRVPEEVASRLETAYDSVERQFTVTYFNSEYILDWDYETIRRKSDGQQPAMMECIIILNYLAFSDRPVAPAGKWVSLKEIPNGGLLFYSAFLQNTIAPLVKTFGQKPQLLLKCGEALGGRPGASGSASVVFEAFPKIPLCVVVWEGDEEVGANATVLYDPTVEKLLHIETVIGLGMVLGDKLLKLAI